MKAAMFYRRKEIEIIDIPKPEFGADQVLVKVKSCGICGTDNLIFNGQCYAKTPLTLGHEYSGDIVEIGKDVKHLRVGDRVVIDPNIFCNKCAFCKIGKAHLCDNLVSLGSDRNGGFAEFSVVPDTNIHKIDPVIDYDEGALVEPLACCVHGMERAGLEAGDTVLVTGAGIIGNIMVSAFPTSRRRHRNSGEADRKKEKDRAGPGGRPAVGPVRAEYQGGNEKVVSGRSRCAHRVLGVFGGAGDEPGSG